MQKRVYLPHLLIQWKSIAVIRQNARQNGENETAIVFTQHDNMRAFRKKKKKESVCARSLCGVLFNVNSLLNFKSKGN